MIRTEEEDGVVHQVIRRNRCKYSADCPIHFSYLIAKYAFIIIIRAIGIAHISIHSIAECDLGRTLMECFAHAVHGRQAHHPISVLELQSKSCVVRTIFGGVCERSIGKHTDVTYICGVTLATCTARSCKLQLILRDTHCMNERNGPPKKSEEFGISTGMNERQTLTLRKRHVVEKWFVLLHCSLKKCLGVGNQRGSQVGVINRLLDEGRVVINEARLILRCRVVPMMLKSSQDISNILIHVSIHW